MIDRSRLSGASRAFLATGVAGAPLAAYELYLGISRNYYLLLADAYHGLMDALLAILYAAVLSVAYKKSRSFPWGLYNAESLATLLTSIVVAYLVINVLVGSMGSGSLVPPQWTSALLVAGGALSATTVALELRYYRLQLVRADLAHAAMDAAADSVAAVSVVLASAAMVRAVLMVIVAFVVYQSASNAYEAALGLLGAEVHGVGLRRPIEAALRRAGLRPLRIYVARAGSFYLVQVILAMPASATLAEAYRARKRAAQIVRALSDVIAVDVRVVPIKASRAEVLIHSGQAREPSGESGKD